MPCTLPSIDNYPLAWSILALGIGFGFACYMAGRPQKGDVSLSGNVGQPEFRSEGDDMGAFDQEVLPLFEESNAELVAKLRKTALELAARNPEGITADDIHEVCPIPPGVDPRIMGSAFQKQDGWVKAGWMASRRKSTHGRPVRIWKRRAA